MFNNNEEFWIPLADLMTGLMLVFLLITASLLLTAKKDVQIVTESTNNPPRLKQTIATESQIYSSLLQEFGENLKEWHAEIDPKDLSFKFNNTEVLFKTGGTDINPKFEEILKVFIPKYLKIVNDTKFINKIGSVRIDGYTSSSWANAKSSEDAFFLNMQLSQERTVSVMKEVYQICPDSSCKQYVVHNFTTNGYGSSRLSRNPDGTENQQKSQKVEFKIVVKNLS